ncbi:MAG: UDP-3-O-(3-hydroxymyristoyl)glucosamine N-acyltransferase [Cardiobacteriaceae bacterium]|nr:UDP-3-O-(3-hydroxymyristoyl)glucosamine N-acyltransferase [Cardiobacteriaceae bacterium]
MITLQQLAARFGGDVHGDANLDIRGVGTLKDGQPGEIGFLAERGYEKYLADSALSAVIVGKAHDNSRAAQWIVADVKKTWRQVCDLFAPALPEAEISAQALIDPAARIAEGVAIGAGASIGADAVIGKGSRIGANVTIEAGVVLGEDCRIAAGARILQGSHLGKRVMVDANAVIGSRGFGLNLEDGRWQPIAQLGGVVIGDDVEIGACTTIDRGAVRDTVIGEGAKLDNHIQVGHNVVIGAHCIFAGSTVIAGSVTFGKYCVVGGASVFAGHISICDGAQFTGHSSVSKSISKADTYSSALTIMPIRDWKRFVAKIRLFGKEK